MIKTPAPLTANCTARDVLAWLGVVVAAILTAAASPTSASGTSLERRHSATVLLNGNCQTTAQAVTGMKRTARKPETPEVLPTDASSSELQGSSPLTTPRLNQSSTVLPTETRGG